MSSRIIKSPYQDVEIAEAPLHLALLMKMEEYADDVALVS